LSGRQPEKQYRLRKFCMMNDRGKKTKTTDRSVKVAKERESLVGT
jgi:hypothetical protein